MVLCAHAVSVSYEGGHPLIGLRRATVKPMDGGRTWNAVTVSAQLAWHVVSV